MNTFSLNRASNAAPKVLETEVLIIGGGITGTGIMRDLALRGIRSILIDKRDLCAGASGGNHGLLHSGGRYVSTDLEAAIECRQEGALLKHLAPPMHRDHRWPVCCRQKAMIRLLLIPFRHCARKQVLTAKNWIWRRPNSWKPLLSDDLVRAIRVPDATVDPFHLAQLHVAHAAQLVGSVYLPHTEVSGFSSVDGGNCCRPMHRSPQPKHADHPGASICQRRWCLVDGRCPIGRLSGCALAVRQRHLAGHHGPAHPACCQSSAATR
jgi:glycerol-3-phosphate dehydrogenase